MDALGSSLMSAMALAKNAALGYQASFGSTGAGVGTGLASGVGTASMAATENAVANTQRVGAALGLQAQMGLRQAAEGNYQHALQFAMGRQAEVMTHEAAHKSGLGAYGGGINYGYSQMQVPMGNGQFKTIQYINSGHVPVAMPGFAGGATPTTPQQALAMQAKYQHLTQAYKTIGSAASAPHSMSGADASVAITAAVRGGVAAQKIAQMQQFAAKLSAKQQKTGPKAHTAVGKRLSLNA